MQFKEQEGNETSETVLNFVNEHFTANPMYDLFDISGKMLAAINGYLAEGNKTLLAYCDGELVGCRTGSIYKLADLALESVFSDPALLGLAVTINMHVIQYSYGETVHLSQRISFES